MIKHFPKVEARSDPNLSTQRNFFPREFENFPGRGGAGALILLLVLLLFGYQAVTKSKNKLPHGQYTSEPNIFTDSGPSIKLLVGGWIRDAKVILGGL